MMYNMCTLYMHIVCTSTIKCLVLTGVIHVIEQKKQYTSILIIIKKYGTRQLKDGLRWFKMVP